MGEKSILPDYELLIVIVPCGQGSKILKVAKSSGIQGGTILIGYGTHRQPLLEFLELAQTRKEIILMIAPRILVYSALDALKNTFKFHKKNHGIAYVVPVYNFLGSGKYDECCEDVTKGGMNMTIYQAIFTIVDKGNGFKVVEAAAKVGAKGATIVNARGSGIHETNKFFNMEIEPEKEMVLILAKKEETQTIVATIRDELQIDQPGNGIIFVQEVHQTIGIHE